MRGAVLYAPTYVPQCPTALRSPCLARRDLT